MHLGTYTFMRAKAAQTCMRLRASCHQGTIGNHQAVDLRPAQSNPTKNVRLVFSITVQSGLETCAVNLWQLPLCTQEWSERAFAHHPGNVRIHLT
eukprot:1626252-Amphidinium_carterae.1